MQRKNQYQYVIRLPKTERGLEPDAVIGPFPTRDLAETYLAESGTEYPCTIMTVLKPVDDPSDDADLNP